MMPEHSNVSRKINVLVGRDRNLLGCQVPVCIIGDSAYPIQTMLMKPFTDHPCLTREQKCFNY